MGGWIFISDDNVYTMRLVWCVCVDCMSYVDVRVCVCQSSQRMCDCLHWRVDLRA